jgi:2'-5' RNA ligase
VRLFVAFDLPRETREALAECMARLRPSAGGAKWVRPEALHVTLKFIGHKPDEMLPRIRQALLAIRSPSSVEMQFRGIGFFPSENRPRVVWCGVAASPNLAALAADVSAALEPLGVAAETRAFLAHLTLARWKEPERAGKIQDAAQEFRDRNFGTLRASEFHLFESYLKPSGAEYKKLATFVFTGGAC